MQQLALHFSRKKTQFVNFFSGILQVIQKLAYDIQIQIDKEYHQSVTAFKDYEAITIINACIKMEQSRVQVFHDMTDRLYATLKGFAQNLGNNHKVSMIMQPYENKNQSAKAVIEKKQAAQVSNSPQMIILGPVRQNSKYIEARKPYNSSKTNHQANPVHIPSPFAQKLKQQQLQQSNLQRPQLSTQRSKQKIEILKKTDVCQSLDNYLNKQAKEMLQKNLSRQSSYSSMRKSMSKKFDTPERSHNYENSQIDKRIEEKLGSYAGSNGKYDNKVATSQRNYSSKKLVGMVSPIQKYEFY